LATFTITGSKTFASTPFKEVPSAPFRSTRETMGRQASARSRTRSCMPKSYNRLGAAWNLFTRARVMLPFGVECRTQNFSGVNTISADWQNGTCAADAGQYAMVWTGAPPAAGTPDGPPTAWSDCGLGVSSSSGSSIDVNACPGSGFYIRTTRTTADYRVALVTGYENAIPLAWRNQVQSIGGFVGLWTHETHSPSCQTVSVSADSQGCCPSFQEPCPGALWDTGGGFGWGHCSEAVVIETECRFLEAGSLDAGTPPAGLFYGAHNVQDPPVRCGNVSEAIIDVTVYTDPGFYIAVPLIDLP
jgi:hypothetical protein